MPLDANTAIGISMRLSIYWLCSTRPLLCSCC